jgi:hypothetical protein
MPALIIRRDGRRTTNSRSRPATDNGATLGIPVEAISLALPVGNRLQRLLPRDNTVAQQRARDRDRDRASNDRRTRKIPTLES